MHCDKVMHEYLSTIGFSFCGCTGGLNWSCSRVKFTLMQSNSSLFLNNNLDLDIIAY